MHRWRIVLFLVVLSNVPLLGQTDKFELFGGYSLERIAPGCGSNYTCGTSSNTGFITNLNGWAASATGYFYKSVGVSAQFSGNYNSSVRPSSTSVHRHELQFGPVYTLRWHHASAFAHGLFGFTSQGSPLANASSYTPLNYTKFIWSVGGGLDIKVSRYLSVRAGQIDYERQLVPVGGSGTNPNPTFPSNGLRYSAGVVLRF